MRRPLVLLAVGLLATTGALADKPQPGLYRITTAVQGAQLPGGSVTASVKECVTAEDLDMDPASLLGDQPGAEGCSISSADWRDGKISMQMRCAMEGMQMAAESRGTYDTTRYDLTTTMRMNMGGMTMQMETVVSGERIGDC